MKNVYHYHLLNIAIHEDNNYVQILLNAAGDDYLPNAVDITFPADELGDLELNRIVNIPITDDVIDEADREYFLLYLTLTSTPLPGLELGTTVSIGGIDDNDGK